MLQALTEPPNESLCYSRIMLSRPRKAEFIHTYYVPPKPERYIFRGLREGYQFHNPPVSLFQTPRLTGNGANSGLSNSGGIVAPAIKSPTAVA